MSKKRTTAGDLIAMLSELNPETHVFVDIGMYDWDYSDGIELVPVESGDNSSYNRGKFGAVHIQGRESYGGTE